MPSPRDSVRIVNNSDKPFRGVFEQRATVVRPGSVEFVPWAAACTWFGNPELRNTETSRQREAEFKHLLAKYGVYHHAELAPALLPKIEVTDLQGNRIYMVLDDPDGRLANAPDATDASSTEAQVLERRVYEMQNQLTAMVSVLQELDPEKAKLLGAAFSTSVPAGADAVPAGATPPAHAANAHASAPASAISGPPSAAYISPEPSAIDTLPALGDTDAMGMAPTDGPSRVTL